MNQTIAKSIFGELPYKPLVPNYTLFTLTPLLFHGGKGKRLTLDLINPAFLRKKAGLLLNNAGLSSVKARLLQEKSITSAEIFRFKVWNVCFKA